MNHIKSWVEKRQNYIKEISKNLFSDLRGPETLGISFHWEQSQFHRFSQSKIRQSTELEQIDLAATLIYQGRSVDFSIGLSGDLDRDKIHIKRELALQQTLVRNLPEHPFCPRHENHGESFSVHDGKGIAGQSLFDELLGPVKTCDLAGHFVSGPIMLANLNSTGQEHLFATDPFFFDFSLYTGKQRAVKGIYSGRHWKTDDYKSLIKRKIEQLTYMDLPRKKVARGKYRTFLSPAAVAELLHLFNWNGPSYRAYKEGQSPLADLKEHKKKFSPLFSLNENYSLGLSPRFNHLGEVCEPNMDVIRSGVLENLLVTTKSSLEYKVPTTKSSASESMRSAVIEPGQISENEILAQLGTGLYLDNLHYLNWSDINHGRLTGMTRFACLWVEDGKIVGPIEDLRFDDTLYHLWGEGLVGLTQNAQVVPEISTYGSRTFGGVSAPGMLIENMSFTL